MSNSEKKITVGLVTPVAPPAGGMAIQAQKLVEHLRQEGLAVVVFATNPDFPRPFGWLMRVKGGRTFFRFFLYLYQLRRLRSVDIVHILGASHFYFFASVAPAVLLGKLFGKKVLLNYRGGEAAAFFAEYKKFVALTVNRADLIAVPSEFLREVFVEQLGCRVEVLPNIADFEKFPFRQRTSFQPKIVVARSLEPIYGHRVILQAFARLLDDYPNALLRIAGEGSLKSELENVAADLGITEKVHFLGNLSVDELAGVYDNCDLMVNASTADNFPGALLEAFMCGLPVVTTDAGGIPCMVKNHENGVVCKVNDVRCLTEGMLYLLQNPHKAAAFATQARLFAMQYSWPRVRQKLFELYGLEVGS